METLKSIAQCIAALILMSVGVGLYAGSGVIIMEIDKWWADRKRR